MADGPSGSTYARRHEVNLTFAGRSVLVAGASQGIGEAIAGAFAAAGASVIIGGRRTDQLAAAAARLDLAAKGRVRAIAGNYADAADIARVVTSAGAVDVLVVCYGDTDTTSGLDTSDADWERVITNNLSGPARLARRVAAGMKARGRGVILFIGSICGHEELGAPVGYTVGKTGLRGLVKAMARELGPQNIRVNMISPGNVLFEGGRWDGKRAKDPAAVDALIKNTVPLGRFGTPDDIAQAALFLCADASSFITGSDLVVDGGQSRVI
jgi:3-oxoacyl-[acyl-carrier protein] reductase